jgi:hypothetical protein
MSTEQDPPDGANPFGLPERNENLPFLWTSARNSHKGAAKGGKGWILAALWFGLGLLLALILKMLA